MMLSQRATNTIHTNKDSINITTHNVRNNKTKHENNKENEFAISAELHNEIQVNNTNNNDNNVVIDDIAITTKESDKLTVALVTSNGNIEKKKND